MGSAAAQSATLYCTFVTWCVCVYVSSLAAGIHQPQHVGAFSHGFSVLEMFVVANRIYCEQNESTDGVWWWHQPSELSHQPHVAIAISISKYTTHKHLITFFFKLSGAQRRRRKHEIMTSIGFEMCVRLQNWHK